MGDDDGQARRRKGKTKGKGEMLDDVVMAQKKKMGAAVRNIKYGGVYHRLTSQLWCRG